MIQDFVTTQIASLPKTELHVHLEGSIQPATVCALAARYGEAVSENEVRARYGYGNFAGFIQAFKWVTSFLREPQDYGLIASELATQLLEQRVVYAEVTLSIGVMLWRNQDVRANFAAILEAVAHFRDRGLHFNFVFDAVRQFGAGAAMEVVKAAERCDSGAIVAFGIGGDEMSVPTEAFREVYERAADGGLYLLIHAGETGGPEKIREAIELLGVERVGHGIAAFRDPVLMDLLAERKIVLEICPASNLRTGALAQQLGMTPASMEQHPLPSLLRHGIPIVLSTDDPAMFETSLLDEYRNAARMGLKQDELLRLVEMGFENSFMTEAQRTAIATFQL